MGGVNWGPHRNKSKRTRRDQRNYAHKVRMDALETQIQKTAIADTVESFIARGGRVKKYAYKEPPVWKKTFGNAKAGKRYGKGSTKA